MLSGLLRKSATCFAAAIMVAGAPASRALEPGTPLARLGRQSWSVENGLPQNAVPVLLQTHTGYLLAGTESGLARFDGAGFRIFDHATAAPFPDAEVRCLLDAKKGSRDDAGDDIWVGTADGLVHMVNDRAVLLTTQNGLPSNSLRGLAQSTDGTVWAWTEAGLARWTGSRFDAVALRDGQPGSDLTSIAADGYGGLWAATRRGAVVLRQGSWSSGPATAVAQLRSTPRTAMVAAVPNGDVLISSTGGVYLVHGQSWVNVLAASEEPTDEVNFLARLTDGAIAVASQRTLVLAQVSTTSSHVLGRFAVSKQLPGSRIEAIFADHEGRLWVGANRGLARIAASHSGATIEMLPPTDPLATHAVMAFLEDREGDLWVGTETAGLHILRDSRFRALGAGDGLSSDATTAIVQDTRHTMWIGTRDSGLNRLTVNRTDRLTTANGLLSNVILSLAVANDVVWVGTPDGLNRVDSHVTASFTSADGLPDDFIRSLLVAADGSLWIGTRRGLTHYEHGSFRTMTHADGLGSDLVGALAQAPDGDIWIATLNGLSRLHQGRLHNYTTADGLSSNVITALEVAPRGMLWVGTQSDGLNLWAGGHFVALSNPSFQNAPLVPAVVHAIVRDDRSHLWLATDAGLTRLDEQPLLACVQRGVCGLDAAHPISFTTADGLRSRETSSNSHPTACRASDGQLWFASPRGVIVVDPLHFPADLAPPPVAIERFAVDDRDENAKIGDRMRIGAGHLRFQFDYAGLSFAAPQKVHYQYMLEGFDRGWTDAGTRRTAYYTNISPGSYRFRVRAAMDDTGFAGSARTGTEAASGSLYYASPEASLAFVLLPRFYQTAWFRILAIAAVVVLVVLIFRRRVVRVEREFRAVMAERNRIAREIHDTLAQGYVGISLQLEILGQLLRQNNTNAATRHLETTQTLVREGLNDARQSIWALRSQDSAEQILPIRLRRQVEQAQDRALDAMLEVHGVYRGLPANGEQELLRIAQEAIHNVKRHANASRMQVSLEYGEQAVALTISDNGTGFVLATGARRGEPVRAANAVEGHYGLVGMQERAAVLHAELTIESAPGKGTSVRVLVPVPPAMPTETSPAINEEKL